MSNLCDGSDPDSDTGVGGAEEEEGEEAIEVEEDGEEAEVEGDMSNLFDGSDPDSDTGVGGPEEEEGEEVIEVEEDGEEAEEDGEEAEEEEDADGGDEGTEVVEKAEEAATAVVSEEENEGSEDEEQGEGGSVADSPPDSPAPVEEDVEDELLLEEGTCTEILGDRQPTSTKDSVDTVKEAPLLKEEELVEAPHKRNRSGDLDGILHSEKNDSNLDRSQMAGFHENCNKKPAIACTFFASGWCVKGSSCRFLHQKDVDVATQSAKENLSGTSSQIDLKEDTGQDEVDRFYAPHKSLMSSAESSTSKSLQRALVRAYGGHDLPKFEGKDSQSLFQTDSSLGTKTWNAGVQLTAADSGFFPDRHRITYAEGAGIPRSSWPSSQLSGFPHTSLFQAEDVKSYDTTFSSKKQDSHFNCIDGGGSTMVGGFISRKYLGEGKVPQELSTKEYADDRSFSRGSPVTKNGVTTEYKYCSSNPLMHSSISLSTSSPNATDRRISDSVALHGPNTSYCSRGLFNSSLQDSPSHALHSSNSSQQNPVHSTFDSMPLGTEDVGTYKLNYERGYRGLWSSSPLPPFGQEKLMQKEIAGSTLVSVERKVKSSADAWEPSVPFRSSFYCPAAGISSPASQYDPLSDSIEPSQSLRSQHKSIDDIPKGSRSLGDNDLKFNISFRKSHEPIVSKSTSEHRPGMYSSSNVGVSGLGTLDGVNRSSIVKEKSWSPAHVIDVQNMKENDYEDGPRTQEEKNKHQRETKALKNFRACLVELVKDLVKPAWREGHLSKDAHKMVVKKAAEKVVSAMQAHQIPTSLDAINQYLSSSRPKIVKLVEGYVDKYGKS